MSSKFDWGVFYDICVNDYSYIFNKAKYTEEEAKKIFLEENSFFKKDDIKISTVYIHYEPNILSELREELEMYDVKGVYGDYFTCEKEDYHAVECWQINY